MESESMAVNRRGDGWPECFQDVSSWCPPDQDELNTPQITLQDEFNFSIDGHMNNCNNNWGYIQSPVELNESWLNQDLLPSPNVMITEEENNNYSEQNSFSLNYMKTDMSESLNKADYSGSGLVIEASGSNVLKTKGNVLLSQATLLREDSPSTGEAQTGFTDCIKLNSSQLVRLGSGGKLFKSEILEELRVPAVEHHLPAAVLQHQQQQVPVLPRRASLPKSKPKLKLTIPQAPSANETYNASLAATPEVIKTLTDTPRDFDLLKYVCEGSEFSAKTQNSVKKERVTLVQDHDYTDSKGTSNDNEGLYIKCEPMSPSGLCGNKRPLHIDDEDDLDSDPSVDDSESEEWSPSGKQSRRMSLSGRPKKRGRKQSSIDSSDGQDKYRALRDRNNEASRRSRLNRKQKDMEMRRHRSELERKNVELRVKADRMEAHVKEMRALLMKSITNSKCNSS